MTKSFLLLVLVGVTVTSGCVMSKSSTDRTISKYVSKNTALVKEAVEFSISATYNKFKHDFVVADVTDKEMRKKIASLGSSVYVTYNNGTDYEIPDSNVTFKTITLFGVTEVVYDFAATPREVVDNTKNKQSYYFVKLADRIYYRRRPFPMM